MPHAYVRKGVLPAEDVLPLICVPPQTKTHRKLFGVRVKMTSARLRLFATKGIRCIACGLEGKYFALEKHQKADTEKYHLNLYGKNCYGEEVMLTQDHVVPKSKGGSNDLSNLQVLCEHCNVRKSDEVVS